MENEIKIGIVGCGGIAQAHLAGYRKNNLKITAISDVNREAAEKMASGIEGCKVFDDFKGLIKSGEVNAISICTPPVAHEETAVFALQNSVHVLCEKPFAHTVEAARNICRAASKSNALIMPAFRHRFLPAVVKMKEVLSNGEIGTPVFFNNVFCGPSFAMKDRWFTKKKIAGGGCIFDTSSHSIDLFRFIVGEVSAQKAVMHRHFDGTDVEDAGIISVKAENGAVGSMISAFVAGTGKAFIDIMGQKGEILYDYTEPDKIKKKVTSQKEWEIIPVESSNGFSEQIIHFVGAIQGMHPLSCTAKDGLMAVEIIQAIYK